MPSETYRLFREAILGEKQVVCIYQGYYCDSVLSFSGIRGVRERLLAYQFAGDSKSGLPPGGQWKCLDLSQVEEAMPRDGPWREGKRHSKTQTWVEDVDLDINIHVRKRR